jgi:hypothetical protein
MTRRCLVLAAMILCLPTVAGAQTVYWSDRPIVQPKGQREVNLDLSVDLNKGALGETFGVGAGLAGDRYSGLHFSAGILKNFEMGMAIQFLYSMHKGADYALRAAVPVDPTRIGRFSDVTGAEVPGLRPPRLNAGPEGNGTRRIAGLPYNLGSDSQTHLNPITIYARYAFLPQLGLELALIVPIEQNGGNNRPSFRLGVPFKWILSPGLLSVHAQPDLIVGFAKTGTGVGEPRQTAFVSYFVDAGVTLSLAGAFLDVTLGYGGDAYPYNRGYLPMSFLLGYTILPHWDVYAGVSLDNLVPKTGKGSDSRRLSLGTSIRF